MYSSRQLTIWGFSVNFQSINVGLVDGSCRGGSKCVGSVNYRVCLLRHRNGAHLGAHRYAAAHFSKCLRLTRIADGLHSLLLAIAIRGESPHSGPTRLTATICSPGMYCPMTGAPADHQSPSDVAATTLRPMHSARAWVNLHRISTMFTQRVPLVRSLRRANGAACASIQWC